MPHSSVTVTVTVALQVPVVEAVFVSDPLTVQLSVAVVAVNAAACAAATVG